MAFSPKRSTPMSGRVRATTPKGSRPAENNFHAIAQIHSSCLDASSHTGSSRARSTTPTRKASEPITPLMPCMYCGTLATRAHQAKCSRRPVVCVGCGQRDLAAASLVAHQQRACPASLISCPGCSESIKRGAVQKHIIRECPAQLFVCPDCGEGFNTPDEFVGHAYPRCKSGFVSCQLCNEPVSAALLAEHYALCAQKVLASSQTQQELKDKDSSKPVRTSGNKSHLSQPTDLLSMHNRLLEKQVTGRTRRSHSQTSQLNTKYMYSGVQGGAGKGYMSATNASVTRCVFADPRSPPRGYIYINQPLTSRRSATPSRKGCEDKKEEGPQWASEGHTSSDTSGDVENTCPSREAKTDGAFEEQLDADNWPTSGQERCSSDAQRVQDAQVEAVFSERVNLAHATTEEKKSGPSTHSEAPTSPRTVVGVSARNWWGDSVGERRVLKVNPPVTERTPSPRCESPNRSKRETTPQTTDGTINTSRPLSIPRVSAPLPSDSLINYNIHSKSPIRVRARAASTLDLDSSTRLASSSSRILLQEALDKPLLPRAPPTAEAVHTKDDVPLSHSPQRERSAAADAGIPTFSAIGCPPPARGGSIPRSLSPHHSYNSYSHRQRLHQQALLESNKSPVQSRLGVVGSGIYGLPIGLTSVSPLPASRGQHRLTRPLMQAQSEEELKADPRFARLTKAEKDAALRDIRLKVKSLKARAVVKERDGAGRAAAMMSPENIAQRSALIMSPTTSSGALRRSVTPPARNHAGRPFKL